MNTVRVRDIYCVDTISKGNSKAWVTLMNWLANQPEDEKILFDFKGIEVVQPWATPEFKLFMQDKRVNIKLWCSAETVNSINIMCKLGGINENKAVNEDIIPEKTLTKEEKKIIDMGKQLQAYFGVEDDGVPVLYANKRFDQIGVHTTVAYIEAALKQYASENGCKKMKLEAGNINIQPSVIESITNLIQIMADEGIELEINSNDAEVMNKVGMYQSLAKNKVLSDMDKRRLIRATMTPGKVGMLVKYKQSKATDEFGRSGKGKAINCRVALFLGYAKGKDNETLLRFRTYNGNTFYTRAHWALENDNHVLKDLEHEDVNIRLSQFGMYNDFLGSNYHLLTPVQYKQEDSIVMYGVNEEGKVTYTNMTIPERIKAVFDDFGVDYDRELIDSYIEKTREILG